jgi:hypothetical protein
MKSPASVVLALALLLAGCAGKHETPLQTSKPVFDSPSGPVILLNLSRDEDKRTIDAEILVSDSRRHVVLKPLEGAPYEIGFCAEMTDEYDELLFRMQFAWDLEYPEAMWMQEQTNLDELTLTVTHAEHHTTEEYDINGDSLFVDYPAIDEDLRQSVLTRCVQRESLIEPSPEETELAEQFARFERFYSRHADNTLNNNEDGALLAFLINDRDFVEYIVRQSDPVVYNSSGTARPRPDEVICAIASACSFKCYFGGLANPLCAPCVGVAVACVIATIACWILDCGP